jgi:large subunit ribosomal protein L22
MEVTSTYRFARISAFKAREVTREIQGLSASDALDILTFSPKKAALLVKKTLRSAIANAENNASLSVETLLVKEAVAGEGPTFKRFRARARGGASPLRKRTSHIRIVLSDDLTVSATSERARKRTAASAPPKLKATSKEGDSKPAAEIPENEKATASAEETIETNPAEEKE